MAACDVLVNLRSPTMGETSGSVIRALSLGKPMLVSDIGWFSEIPDGAALRIPVDEYEVPTIAAALELAADRGAELGAAAREYVRRDHELGQVADAYVAALEEAAGGDAAPTRSWSGSPRQRPRSGSTIPPRSCGRARRRGWCERRDRERGGRVRARAVAVPAWVWLGAIVVCSSSCASRSATGWSRRGSWSTRSSTPSSPRSFAAHGQFLVRGVP